MQFWNFKEKERKKVRKVMICALTMSLVLLCACGADGTQGNEKKDGVTLLQEEYQSFTSCDMTAKVRSLSGTNEEKYTLRCLWNADETAEVEVQEPEELAGIRASFEHGAMTLAYEDVSLAAGLAGAAELSPAEIVPCVIDAIRTGYVLEKNGEQIDGEACVRLLFHTTETRDHPVDYAVWFKKGHTPVRAEVIEDGKTLFEIDFIAFAAEAMPAEPKAV